MKIGDTLEFMFRGEMTSFEIIDMGLNMLKIRSLDLEHESTIPKSKWEKQKRILNKEK